MMQLQISCEDALSTKYTEFYSGYTAFFMNLKQIIIQGDTKKRELLKNPTKIEEIQEKKLLTEIELLQLAF